MSVVRLKLKKETVGLVGFLTFTSLCMSLDPARATVVVTGSGEIGGQYDSNIYHTKEDKVTEFKSFVIPEISIESQQANSNIRVEYTPMYLHNHRRSEYTFDNEVGFLFNKKLSSKTTLELSNDFIHENDPPSEAFVGTTLSRQFVQLSGAEQNEVVRLLFDEFNWPGGEFDNSDPIHIAIVQTEIQERYDNSRNSTKVQVDNVFIRNTDLRGRSWSNTTQIQAEYAYQKNSLFTYGYGYLVSENNRSNISDSDTHHPYFAVEHELSDQLDAIVTYDLFLTNYDTSEDSDIHDAYVELLYQFSQESELSSSFRHINISYDGTRDDRNINRLIFELDHDIDQFREITLRANPYYIDSDRGLDERGLNLEAIYTTRMRKGFIEVGAEFVTADIDLNSGWNDLRDSWLLKSRIEYEPAQDLITAAYLTYGQKEIWTTSATSNYDDYTGGVEITYPLGRYCEFNLNYRFTRLDTSDSLTLDDYYNNTIFFTLSASNDFWRWLN